MNTFENFMIVINLIVFSIVFVYADNFTVFIGYIFFMVIFVSILFYYYKYYQKGV